MRLVEKSRKSGAGIDEFYIPRLWCFDNLSFLNDGDTIRPSLSKINNATNDKAEEHSDHEVRMVCAPVCLSVSHFMLYDISIALSYFSPSCFLFYDFSI